ncbi:hypothetical protein ACA910_000916 [Epithemia clementina (nom. ined.)]
MIPSMGDMTQVEGSDHSPVNDMQGYVGISQDPLPDDDVEIEVEPCIPDSADYSADPITSDDVALGANDDVHANADNNNTEDDNVDDDDEIEIPKSDDPDLECPSHAITAGGSVDVVDSSEVKDDYVVADAKTKDENKPAELSYSQQMARARFLHDRRVEALSEQRYHLPNNNWIQDWFQYFANNHPLLGICFHDPDHPVGWQMRLLCFISSVVFGLAITNVFWLWARNDDENHAMLLTVETGTRPGSNLTGYVVNVNEDNDVEVTKDMVLLWTLGGMVHGMFDNLIWTLSICACCNPGGRFELLSKYKKIGVGLLTFFILIIVAVSSLSVVLRGVMEEEEEPTDVKELKSAGVFDDAIDLTQTNKDNYEFLMSYFVELSLEFAVYFPLIGTILFAGLLAFLRLPQFQGRSYEVELEEHELQKILEHPERYFREADDLEDEPAVDKGQRDGLTTDYDDGKSRWNYVYKRRRISHDGDQRTQGLEGNSSDVVPVEKSEKSDM